MNLWDLIVQQPIINVLIMMSHYLGGSFGVAIIALTIIINAAMFPLTLKQIRASKLMQDMQPKLAELQKKFGKDRQRMAQEQMKLYKELGMSPAGCLGPMVIQMPIWLALYQAVMLCLAVAPEGLLNLSRYLYPWPILYSIVPLARDFFWLDLAMPNMFLAILVGGTMWLQQKMSTPLVVDPKQQAQNRMMLWMMPLMFTFFALSFPSGLALFWVTSSIVRIVVQYRVTGWGGVMPKAGGQPVGRIGKGGKYITRLQEERTSADITADGSPTGRRRKGGSLTVRPPAPKNRPEKNKDQSQKE